MTFLDQARDLLERRDAGAAYAVLARLAGWQESSVRSIVSKARCGKLERHPRAGIWTPAMDKTLKAHWETDNSHQIAQRLTTPKRHVSHWAVNARARRLGLSKVGHPANWRTP